MSSFRNFFFLLLAIFIFSCQLQALEIAFLVHFHPDGSIQKLEENGRYYHVAMKKGNQWLHATPHGGVILSNSLEDIGEIEAIFFNKDIPEPSDRFLIQVLGKPYNLVSDWWNNSDFNCTKLVARYLGLPPLYMFFAPQIWGFQYDQYNGLPGMSPDDLFRILSKEGFEQKFLLSPMRKTHRAGCLSALRGYNITIPNP